MASESCRGFNRTEAMVGGMLQNRASFGARPPGMAAFAKRTPRAFAAPEICVAGPELGIAWTSGPSAALRQFGTFIAW